MIQQFHLWVLTLTGKVICTSMFTAALFTIGKICKQPKCPLMDEENMIYIYIHTYNGILFRHKKENENEILPIATTWMDLEGTGKMK